MKILKIFGIVAGIHVFALVLIFANPGCSSKTVPPAPSDTTARSEASVPILAPTSGSSTTYTSPSSSLPITFDPNAPAVAASSGAGRYTPTRPSSPAAGALVSEPVVDVTPATTYTVKAGDTLSGIAKKHHLTVAELTSTNGLKANAILRPNQKLMIPGKPASPTAAATPNPQASPARTADAVPPAAAASRASGGSVKHTVKSGETLGSIARNYGVRVADIAVANNITDPGRISAGTELVIPGWESKGETKSGKASSKSSTKKAEPRTTAPVEPAPLPTQSPTPIIQTPPVPTIPVDDSPLKPAPKS